MERLEAKKGRSPISSLNFERKSDFKKFLKFIKNETEELKGMIRLHAGKETRAIERGKIMSSMIDIEDVNIEEVMTHSCLLYTSPSPRDLSTSRMPSSA